MYSDRSDERWSKRWMKPRGWWQERKSVAPRFEVVLSLFWYPSGWGFLRQLGPFRTVNGVWGLREQGRSKVVLGKERAGRGQAGGSCAPRGCVLAARADWCHCSPVVACSSPSVLHPKGVWGQEGAARARASGGKWARSPFPPRSCLRILPGSSSTGEAVTSCKCPWTGASSDTSRERWHDKQEVAAACAPWCRYFCCGWRDIPSFPFLPLLLQVSVCFWAGSGSSESKFRWGSRLIINLEKEASTAELNLSHWGSQRRASVSRQKIAARLLDWLTPCWEARLN